MTFSFVETTDFTDLIAEYFGSDEHYLKLQATILKDPGAGQVIQGTGGLRKLRWTDPRRGKGKRGGLRIIYLHVPAGNIVVLLDVYDKDEADDLSPAVRRVLSEQVSQLQEFYKRQR